MLEETLSQLKGYDVVVWDDNSNFRLTGDFYFYQFSKNYGKKNAWRKFQRIFNFILNEYDYDYYIFIPDDVVLCKDFVKKSIELYESILDNSKICLSLLSDDRIKAPCWTNLQPKIKGDVILSQWNDLCFIAERKFFEEVNIRYINPDRWEGEKRLGSGVGGQISRNLLSKGYNMYHAKDTLCEHRKGHISKMNNYAGLRN